VGTLFASTEGQRNLLMVIEARLDDDGLAPAPDPGPFGRISCHPSGRSPATRPCVCVCALVRGAAIPNSELVGLGEGNHAMIGGTLPVANHTPSAPPQAPAAPRWERRESWGEGRGWRGVGSEKY